MMTLTRLLLLISLTVSFVSVASGQCVIRAIGVSYGWIGSSDTERIVLSNEVIFIYESRKGKVLHITLTDSAGNFTIPEDLCEKYGSLFVSFGSFMYYEFNRIKVECCKDTVTICHYCVLPFDYDRYRYGDWTMGIILEDGYSLLGSPKLLSTGYPSSVELPFAVSSVNPLVAVSRKSDWDVTPNYGGLDAKRISSSLAGIPYYSACPMEMGGDLVGVNAFLLKYSTVDNGSWSNFISRRFDRNPTFNVSLFSNLTSLGSGFETGVKSEYSSTKWHAYSGIAHSQIGSYYAGEKTLVTNSGYVNTNAIFSVSYKKGELPPDLFYFFTKTEDAGYPTMPHVKVLKEERHFFSLGDYFNISKDRIGASYFLSYQPTIHVMSISNLSDGNLLSTTLSRVYNASGSVGFPTLNFGNHSSTISFISYITKRTMNSYLTDAESNAFKYPEINDAMTLEWGNGLEFWVSWDMKNHKSLFMSFNLGSVYLSWLSGNKPARRFVLPVFSTQMSLPIAPFWDMKFALSYSFRMPTPMELFRQHIVLPNGMYLISFSDSLLPEKVWTVKLNFSEEIWRGGYRGLRESKKVKVDLQAFARLIKDYIHVKEVSYATVSLPPDAFKVGAYQNVGDLLLAGVGIKFEYSHKDFKGTAMLGWTWGEFLDTKKPAPYTFPFYGKGSAEYRFLKWISARLFVEGMPSQTRINPDFGQVPSPSYVKIDFSLNGKVNSWLEFTAYVNNILDQYYFLPTSYGAVPEPGRFFGLMLKVNFQKRFPGYGNSMVAEYTVPAGNEKSVKKIRKTLIRESNGIIKVSSIPDSNKVRIWLDYESETPYSVLDKLKEVVGKPARLVNVYLYKEK